MVEIRAAGEQDADVVFQLIMEEARYHNAEQHVHTSASELRRAGLGKGKQFGVLLAECDGAPAGYVSYTLNYSIWLGANHLLVDDVFVVSRFRGRKIGEMLMRRAKQLAEDLGCVRVRWEVDSGNQDAIRFYQRLGAALITKGIFAWPVECATARDGAHADTTQANR